MIESLLAVNEHENPRLLIRCVEWLIDCDNDADAELVATTTATDNLMSID